MKKEKEDLKFVIVGHVDHGKSTLIGRIFYDTDSIPEEKKREIETICKDRGLEMEFAFVMDQLEEEQSQGITIDTTQTFFKTDKRNYIIIDAPGHKEFLKNMITGASQAEAAILIIDGKEGVQEQTRRHSYLLNFLGIKQVIAVINKMDLIEYREDKFNNIKKDLITFLNKINIKPSFIIPASAKKGDNISMKSENMPWYKGKTLLESLDAFKTIKFNRDKPLRFPVQDVYKTEDKRIIVGRVESGLIKQGENIIFMPSKKEACVKSIEVFEKKKQKAETGESIGITTEKPLFVERGEVICKKNDDVNFVDSFSADVFFMSEQPIKTNQEVLLRTTTQEVRCEIESIKRKINSSTLELIEEKYGELNDTEVGEVIIKTKNPIVVEKFNYIPKLGRFILARNDLTIAGGIIKGF